MSAENDELVELRCSNCGDRLSELSELDRDLAQILSLDLCECCLKWGAEGQ